GKGNLRFIAAGEADTPRLLAAGAAAGEMATKDVSVVVRSLPASLPRPMTVRASGEDGALLAREPATIAPGDASTAVRLPLPTELRNRVARIEIEGEDSAGAVLLVDERWRPRLAEQSDDLVPVRRRRGGRTLGGALSWEMPARLARFAAEGPFAGLALPADVTVSRQVLAEPDIALASKAWARLADGTPVGTAE